MSNSVGSRPKVLSGAYYLPVYFQVLGSSATGAGVRFVKASKEFPNLALLTIPSRMLPYSLGAAFISAISGQVVTKTGRWRPVMWFSWVIIVLGYGLMTQLDEKSNKCVYFHVFLPHSMHVSDWVIY